MILLSISGIGFLVSVVMTFVLLRSLSEMRYYGTILAVMDITESLDLTGTDIEESLMKLDLDKVTSLV